MIFGITLPTNTQLENARVRVVFGMGFCFARTRWLFSLCRFLGGRSSVALVNLLGDGMFLDIITHFGAVFFFNSCIGALACFDGGSYFGALGDVVLFPGNHVVFHYMFVGPCIGGGVVVGRFLIYFCCVCETQ